MPRPLTLAAVVALAACQAAEAPFKPAPDPAPPAPDLCGAGDLAGLIGQPNTVLERMVFDGPVRVIPPGTAVTMDYMPKRINFELDKKGLIRRIRCG